MSNLTVMQEASRASLQAIAIGEARGAQSITVYALACAADTAAGVWNPDNAGVLYSERFAWVNAECLALGKEEISVPKGKSLAAQVSKFRGFLELGALSAQRADILTVLRDAAAYCGHNYKKTLASVVAMRTCLAKDADVSVDDLLGAALAAQETLDAKPATASEAFAKIAKGWDKFLADFPDMARAIDAKRPALTADAAGMLTKFGAALQVVEGEAALLGL